MSHNETLKDITFTVDKFGQLVYTISVAVVIVDLYNEVDKRLIFEVNNIVINTSLT